MLVPVPQKSHMPLTKEFNTIPGLHQMKYLKMLQIVSLLDRPHEMIVGNIKELKECHLS